jgi:hypothetical protein
MIAILSDLTAIFSKNREKNRQFWWLNRDFLWKSGENQRKLLFSAIKSLIFARFWWHGYPVKRESLKNACICKKFFKTCVYLQKKFYLSYFMGDLARHLEYLQFLRVNTRKYTNVDKKRVHISWLYTAYCASYKV